MGKLPLDDPRWSPVQDHRKSGIQRLAHEEIDLPERERQALIGLGRLGEKRLREILTNTDSRSYRLIWQENKPTLKAVEN